jgi:hypothetical protein
VDDNRVFWSQGPQDWTPRRWVAGLAAVAVVIAALNGGWYVIVFLVADNPVGYNLKVGFVAIAIPALLLGAAMLATASYTFVMYGRDGVRLSPLRQR